MADGRGLRSARVLLLASGNQKGVELSDGRAALAKQHRFLAAVLTLGLGLHCADGTPETAARSAAAEPTGRVETRMPLRLEARVVASFPHDPGASTQGLLWHGGVLYESTGLWGESSLRRVALQDGAVIDRVDLDSSLFGEGLARVDEELVQLTWQSGRAIRYGLESLEVVGESRYDGQGWGLCYDGADLWRSDGSAVLRRHHPETFAENGSVRVEIGGEAVEQLNELECAEGWIYANVWQRDEILRIDAASGRVVAVIDASALLPASERRALGALNGIAYRPETQTFLLTGKKWPGLFEVVFVEPPA